jgi:hypothetical protein
MKIKRAVGRAMLTLLVGVAALVNACTTIDSLKPGVTRGTYESGFLKTTEGLALEVRGRSYDDIWAAADTAVTSAGTVSAGVYSGRLRVVESHKDSGVIKSEEENFLGLTRAYVGIFIRPAKHEADAYVIEVSKILKSRTEVIEGRDWEVDLLRAIQTNLKAR